MPDWDEVTTAVESMTERVVGLLRSVEDPDVPALGVWTTGQLAAHLTHVFELDRDLLGELPSPLDDLADLGEFTQTKVRDEAVRDPEALARRATAASAEFLEMARGLDGTEPRVWVGGVKVTASVLACHIVSEGTVHGLDLSRAVGRRWRIEQRDARLAFEGFIYPMYRSLDRPAFAVNQRRVAGVRACFDLRIRGGGRVFLVFEDGGVTIEAPTDRKVDCRLWADARAVLLLAWHRTGLVGPVVKGQVLPWGRRPWLALRLPGLLKLP